MPKRILFVCGGLPPGEDGVGDYARMLAAACHGGEQQCAAIALYDQALGTESAREAGAIPILRLGRRMNAPQRNALAAEFVRSIKPDWCSLQFVPFAFHSRGLPVSLGARLRHLLPAVNWHVLFHELWVWGPSLKLRLLGSLQKIVLRRLLARLNPALSHTTNSAYQERLREINVNAGILPLFGAIPVVERRADDWLMCRLAFDAPASWAPRRQNLWFCVFFGTQHPAWSPDSLLRRFLPVAQAAGKQLVFVSIGRSATGAVLWADMKASYAGQARFLELGPQPPETISSVFNAADFGITTSPYAILGKSATVCAMLEHGLPLLVSREDVPGPPDPQFTGHPLIIRFDEQFEARVRAVAPRRPTGSRLPEVTKRFLAELAARQGQLK